MMSLMMMYMYVTQDLVDDCAFYLVVVVWCLCL